MKLDKHVVDMFTELTKPADDVKMEKTCYGTISVVDGTRYVKLDGSDLLVPAASTVKTSHGDRVTVLMKNHSLTVTGNLTAPATDGEGGSSGEAGTAATIEIGTVTTGEAGSSASVTNSGTTSAAVFDFVIPKGDKGEKGDTGPQGPRGEKGDTGTWDGTIPDHEHTVSDITDFPTSLPANGGNAATLGNIPASELERVRTAVVAGEAMGLQWTAMQARKDDTIIRVQVDADYDRVLLFKSIDGGITWTEIPLGNADTLDGLHANEIASNPNLLINPDFRINQRGLSTYDTDWTYTVDRWLAFGHVISVTDNGIFIKIREGCTYCSLLQKDEISGLLGKTITFSSKINGTIYSGSTQITAYDAEVLIARLSPGDSRVMVTYGSNNILNVQIYCISTEGWNIEWAKLELGSVATPFCPPDPATELAKCQRYYQIRSTGNIPAVDLRPSMRATPTVTRLSDGNYAYSAEF